MSTPSDNKFPVKRFGEKLRTLRDKHGMSQKQLGELLDVYASYIGRMERSEKHPNIAMLLKLMKVFEVSSDVLIRDDLDLDD